MSYYDVVSMVKTKDGSTFDYESDAEAYIIDDICSEINEVIKTGDFYDLKHRDLTKIIELLAGDLNAIDKLYAILTKHID